MLLNEQIVLVKGGGVKVEVEVQIQQMVRSGLEPRPSNCKFDTVPTTYWPIGQFASSFFLKLINKSIIKTI